MNKKKPAIVAGKAKRLTGIIKIISKPLGFVVLAESESAKSNNKLKGEDIIVFEENLNCALDKDEVEVEIIGRDRDRKKGRIVSIIKRNKTEFVGTVENSSADGFGLIFIPDDFKFYRKIELKNYDKNLAPNTKVLIKLLDWNNQNLNPQGEILKVIGQKGEHETEMQSILLDKGIVYNFPPEVEQEASQIFASQNLSEQTEDRRDFRNVITFTIDPVDAKDFDDALSYEDLSDDRLRIGVHIADVSYFVRPGSLLDQEAEERGFSTYLVDRTIPMLPEVLSNDLCSLKPNIDRLAFSAVFDIEKSTGKILDSWFGKTIINSNKRFSYEEAQEILNKKEGNFFQELFELNRIANIYRVENKKNGAIEFETDEVRFELDSLGKPVRIYKKIRLDTMKMIEEWMLLANKEVAKFISDKTLKKGGASIFRIHNLPKMERIEELAIFVRALGHELPIVNGEVSAKDINILLKQIEGHASESLIKTATIRSMAKAVYSTKNIGHFGLAFKYYTHFTSPIRRYPDLMVHRILERYLKNEAIPKNEFASFSKIAQEASDKEIIVAEAERESIKYKQVEFMQNKVGQEFDVVISGVTEWGMYVENPETKIEGLVRIKDLGDDFYKLDQKNYCIVGERTKKKFSLGDSLRVRLVSADLNRKTLDFKLV